MTPTKIIDDLLPAEYALQLEADLTSVHFPWYYVNDVTYLQKGNNSGFTHLIYNIGSQPSEWYAFIKPLVYHITQANGHRLNELLRIRVGLLLPDTKSESGNTPHVDFHQHHHTACYYVNDSDGDTILYEQKLPEVGKIITEATINDYIKNCSITPLTTCTPKKNRVFCFDGLHFHASTRPSKYEKILVITVNYTSI